MAKTPVKAKPEAKPAKKSVVGKKGTPAKGKKAPAKSY
jgi:hypothetical protein